MGSTDFVTVDFNLWRNEAIYDTSIRTVHQKYQIKLRESSIFKKLLSAKAIIFIFSLTSP